MLLLLTITQNCFIWRHCRIRIDTYQVLIMNIHSPFLMTPANTKQVNMKARESETTGDPRLHLCQLSYSLDMYQRMWNVGCTHTAEHRLTSLLPKSACSHPLCFLEMSRVVCVCVCTPSRSCAGSTGAPQLPVRASGSCAPAGPLLGMHCVVSPDSDCQSLAGIKFYTQS